MWRCCQGLTFADVPALGLLRIDAFLILIAATGLLLAVAALLGVCLCTKCNRCSGRPLAAGWLIAAGVVTGAFAMAVSGDVLGVAATWRTGLHRAGILGEDLEDEMIFQARDLLRHTPERWRSPRKVHVLNAEECERVKARVLSVRVCSNPNRKRNETHETLLALTRRCAPPPARWAAPEHVRSY